MGWEFPQVKEKSLLSNSATKPLMPWTTVFPEKCLRSSWGLCEYWTYQEEMRLHHLGIVTLQLQWGSFRDQNRVIRLGPWLASGISGQISSPVLRWAAAAGLAVEMLWSLFLNDLPEQTGKWQEKFKSGQVPCEDENASAAEMSLQLSDVWCLIPLLPLQRTQQGVQEVLFHMNST